MSGSRQHFVVLYSDGEHFYDSGVDYLKAGKCPLSRSPSCGSLGVARSYFSLNTGTITARATTAHVYSATVHVYEVHNSGGCRSEPVNLQRSGGISSSTRWGGPLGSLLQRVSSNRSDTCSSSPPGTLNFGNSNVVAYAQSAANADHKSLTFALRAPDETNIDQWKRFGRNPSISITYDFPPGTPSGLTMDSTVSCSGKPRYARDTTPTVHAKSHDNNPSPGNVHLWFEVWNSTTTTRYRYNPSAVSKPSDQLASWTTNSSNTNSTNPLPDRTYHFRARASTGPSPARYSAWSGWYPFTIDRTAPAHAPTITSFDYPQKAWGAPRGTPGTFTFHVNGSSGVAAYAYAYDTSSGETLPTNTDCNYNQAAKHWVANSGGDATITAPSTLSVGYHTLYVKAFDNAHNVSAQSAGYVFYVAPTVAGEGPTQSETENLTPTQPPGQGDPTYNGGNGYPIYKEGASARWSAGYQQHLIPTKTGAKFSYTLTPAVTADYALGVELTSANHYGLMQFTLDNAANPLQVNGETITYDGYSVAPATHYLQLGGAHFTANTTHTLTIQITGKNPNSTGYTYNGTYGGITLNGYNDNGYAAGIDYFTIVPINNVTADNFTDAMNNHGIAVDNTTPANFQLAAGAGSLSSNALATAGLAPGDLFTADPGTPHQATFTMPRPAGNGNDNVIANGQIINLDHDVQTSHLDLLGTAVCLLNQNADSSTAWNAAIRVDLNYTETDEFGGAKVDSIRLPEVPNWLKTDIPPAHTGQVATITLAATLDHDDDGSTPNPNYQPNLYHISIPANPNLHLHSVTLPNLGTNFTTHGCPPAFHVLAMTTPGSYTNAGITDDNHTSVATYDGVGWSYSAQALATQGATPGSTITVDGIDYTWPDVPAGTLDNIEALGQTIPLTAPAHASTIGLLGSSTNAGSTGAGGTATITYTDGTTSQFTAKFSDWTLGAGTFTPLPDNATAITTPYRNGTGNYHQDLNTYIFAIKAPVSVDKTVASITLPQATGGDMHIFAITLLPAPA